MPALLESPPLLAHTIFQALAFDHALEEQYGVDDEDRGVAHVILGNKAWFEAWREAELKGRLTLQPSGGTRKVPG